MTARSPTRIVSEREFRARLAEILATLPTVEIGSVNGPGRSDSPPRVVAALQPTALIG